MMNVHIHIFFIAYEKDEEMNNGLEIGQK